MKFLVHGNAPWVTTGYGVQIGHLVERLRADGHDPAVSSTFGQQGSTSTWRGVTVYPNGYEQNSNDVVHGHALHHFEGDPLGGWLIPVLDVWALVQPALADMNVAAWTPVDHFPAPRDVIGFFKRTGAVPLVMSRFGERQLAEAGLDPVYMPLSVDTTVFKPTPELRGRTGREWLDIPEDAFVVGMVAMNKGWQRDRKGFNEALRAFGAFWQSHPEAILYLHTEKYGGADGINLAELADHAHVPPHAIRFVDQYAYRLGVPAEMMAATYTAMDVLLAPSHGEGFCVPLIEAQACGTPVIATDFSAQTELVGAGWLVAGQPEWDPAQHASYVCPLIIDVVAKLEAAYAADRVAMAQQAIEFAVTYDTDAVYANHWRPFIESLSPVLPADKAPMETVDVIVPAMRPDGLERLARSFHLTRPAGDTATLVAVVDEDFDTARFAAYGIVFVHTGCASTTFAEKVNLGERASAADFVLLVGDDCEFKPGWFEAAQAVAPTADVIGTNDTDGPVKNTEVAAGRHADHFFVRRSYIAEEGACLDGPGVLAPEAYQHWYTDKEIIDLAKARRVFAPCLDSIVVHHHPGYEGREDLRQSDAVYMAAVDSAERDGKLFLERRPLIEMQRVGAGK